MNWISVGLEKLNGLNWENNAFFDSFFNFSPREQKKCYSFSADVFWIPPTFSPLTSLHYSRFGSLRLPRGAVTSSARPPQRTLAFAPDSTALAPDSTTLRSFRSVSLVPKSRSVSKKVFENEHFFCSLVVKKKNQRTLISPLIWEFFEKLFFWRVK